MELIWTSPDELDRARQAVRSVAAAILDHYLHYNTCMTITELSCGHEHSVLVTQAGGVNLFGYDEGIVEHFAYRIIDGLSDKWQEKIAHQREKVQSKHEKKMFNDAKKAAMAEAEDQFKKESIEK